MNTIPPGNYCPQCGEVIACACPGHPAIDYTQAGAQYMIPDAPTRKVPTTGLKPKVKQKETPTVLELYEEIITQPKLF